MTKQGKIILTVVIIIILSAIGYFYSQRNVKNVPANIQTLEGKTWQYPIMQEIVSTLKKHQNIGVSTPDSDYLLWKKDQYVIYLPTSDSITVDYCGLSNDINNGDTEKIFNTTPLGLVSGTLDTLFIKNGYQQDELNSTKIGNYYFAQSYEKDGVLCSTKIGGDISGCGQNNMDRSVGMTIRCSGDLEKAYSEQKENFDILKTILGSDLKGSAISSTKREGGFLAISLTDGTEGAGYILKKESNKYILIDGPLQEEPTCEKMNKWKVPKDIYGSCYSVSQ